MGQIKVTKAPIEGLYVIEPSVHGCLLYTSDAADDHH